MITRTQTRRVYVPQDAMPLYRALISDQSNNDTNLELAPFSEVKDVFLTAACLGFQIKRRKKLATGDKKHEIRLEVIGDDGESIIRAIALAATGDVEILSRQGELLTIVEEYAYAGIYEIRSQLLEQRGVPLWNLVNLFDAIDR